MQQCGVYAKMNCIDKNNGIKKATDKNRKTTIQHTDYITHTHKSILGVKSGIPNVYIGLKCGQANRKNMFYSKLILFDDNIKSFTPNCILGLPTESSCKSIYTFARSAFECITVGCVYMCLLDLN